jgi:hypothetical protein
MVVPSRGAVTITLQLHVMMEVVMITLTLVTILVEIVHAEIAVMDVEPS